MGEQSVAFKMQEAVKGLSELSDSALELELGRRLVQTKADLESSSSLRFAEPLARVEPEAVMFSSGDLLFVAHKFLDNVNGQMYSLVCDAKDEDNKKLREAYSTGVESLALVLSGFLVATFGWLPGIASVLAVLIAKRFLKATYDTACQIWERQVRAQE